MDNTGQRFEVVYTDQETHIVRRKVIPFPSDEFNKLAVKLFDDNDKALTGHFVDNDTPLGERGRGKVFHYRIRSSHYEDKTVNYEIKDGVVRFIDFTPITADGYLINVRHSEDGDLLEPDLKKSKFAPTDGKEGNRICWVLRAAQKFNNELLEEVGDEDDDENLDEEVDDLNSESESNSDDNNEFTETEEDTEQQSDNQY